MSDVLAWLGQLDRDLTAGGHAAAGVGGRCDRDRTSVNTATSQSASRVARRAEGSSDMDL
jgi:hypothetical protein